MSSDFEFRINIRSACFQLLSPTSRLPGDGTFRLANCRAEPALRAAGAGGPGCHHPVRCRVMRDLIKKCHA
jgi:hypothetical protein